MNSLRDLNNFSVGGITYTDTRNFTLSINGQPAPTTSPTPVPQVTVNTPAAMPLNRYIGQTPVQVTSVTGVAESINTTTGDPATAYTNPVPAGALLQDLGTSLQFTGMSPAIFRYIAASQTAKGSTDNKNMRYPAGNVTVQYQWNNTDTTLAASAMPISVPATQKYNQDSTTALTAYPEIFANAGITTAEVTITPYWANTVSQISAVGSGASTRTYPETGQLSITGSPAVVNSYLANVRVTPAENYTGNIYLNYNLKNLDAAAVNIQGSNVFYQVGQTLTSDIYTLKRSYVQHGYGLLFPDNVPTVPAGLPSGQTVRLQLTLDRAIGQIGRDINDAGWNPATLTFDNQAFIGNTATVNSLISSLRFFGARDTSADARVRLQITNGSDPTKNIDSEFDLKGTALTSLIAGGTEQAVYQEDDVITDLGTFTVYPHWSDRFSVTYTTQVSGVTANVGVMSGLGWTSSGTSITRSYAGSTNLAGFTANIASVNNPQLALKPDFNGLISLRQRFTRDDLSESIAVKPFVIQPAGEYTAPASAEVFIYDTLNIGSGFSVTDAPSDPTRTYTVNLTIDNAALGNIFLDNTNAGANLTISGTRSQINSKLASNVTYVAYKTAGESTLRFTAQRTSPDVAYLVNNLSMPFTVKQPVAGDITTNGIYVVETNDSDFGQYHRYITMANVEAVLSFRSTNSVKPDITTETYNQYNGQINTTILAGKTGYTANTAAGYSDTLTHLGKTDWYLPTVDELKFARDENLLTTSGTYWCSYVFDGGGGSANPAIQGLYALPNPSWGAPINWNSITTTTYRRVRPMRRLPR